MKKLIALFVFCTSSISLTYFFFFYALPQRSGVIEIPKLQSDVFVTYDLNGIPHIKSQSELDAFKTLGFITGQHKLFQLDLQRRISTGRLSEILGEKVLELDKLNRSLGFRHYGEKLALARKWSDKTNARIEAYLEGLNYFVEVGRLPVEFKVLKYKPDYFTKAEIISFIGYMSFSFQEAFKQEPSVQNIIGNLPVNYRDELTGLDKVQSPSIDKTEQKPISKLKQENEFIHAKIENSLYQALSLNQSYGYEFNGSNAWAASPERTKNGKVLLANDPHIAHSNPGVWFEASLEYPGKRFHGHFLSFIPFAPMGWSPKLAWTLTMSELDDMDFFILNKNSENYSVLSNKNLAPTTIKEEIHIKGGSEYNHKLKITPYGVIFDDYIKISDDVSVSGYWSFYSDENRALEGLSQMYDSSGLSSFQSALENMTAPGLSISYGDANGNIAWFTLGRTLKRPVHVSGKEFRLAILEEAPSLIPFSENPKLVNPFDGYIVNANHRLSNAQLTKFPGYYQPSDRAHRIENRIKEKKKHSDESFRSILMDNQDWFFPQAKDSLLNAIDKSEIDLSPNILKELKSDNIKATTGSYAFTFYRVWSRIVSYKLLKNKMTEEVYNQIFKTPVRYELFKSLLLKESSIWWDDLETKDKVETRIDILVDSSIATVNFLEERLGPDQTKWTWGNLHQFEAKHPLGRSSLLRKIFNLGPYPASGAYSLVNAQAARDSWRDFSVKSGPSTRRIIDFSHPSWSLGILPTGNSGHRFDKFHNNQLQDYLKGKLQIRKLSYSDIKSQDIDSEVVFTPSL